MRSLLIFATAVCSVNGVYGFMPWDWNIGVAGMGGVSHSAITRNAFQSRASSYWPSLTKNGLTSSMTTARDSIAYANGMVDTDQQHSALHFDGENFAGGQYVITGYPWWSSWQPLGANTLPSNEVNLLSQILSYLNSGDVTNARTALGRACHTIQDFYSHSNWVELGNTSPHPGIGRPGNWIYSAAATDKTCTSCGGPLLSASSITSCENNCWATVGSSAVTLCVNDCNCNNCNNNLVTSSLTSGYYHGEDAVPSSNVAKCYHGGDLDSSGNIIQGINKDSYDCSWSSHGPNYHWIAQNLAQKATEQFIDDIKASITSSHGASVAEHQMQLLFGISSAVGFVVSTTGSMSDIIGTVSSQLTQVINERLNTATEPGTFVFAPYSATWSLTPAVTTDPNYFMQMLGWLWSYGGTTCQEPSMQGVLNAIHYMPPGSPLFLITDGPASDSYLLSSVVSAANANNVQVFTLLFASSCGTDNTYSTLASSTGGQFYTLARNEASQITKQIDYWLNSDLTASFSSSLSSSSAKRSGSETSYDVPVCGSTTTIRFVVRGSCSLDLTSPDGTQINSTDPGVNITTISNTQFITIESPLSGSWTTTLTGTSDCNLDVVSRSSIIFSFSFAEYIGRPGHAGWAPNPKIAPVPGVDMPCLAYLDGTNVSDVTFQIRGSSGEILVDKVPLAPGNETLGQPSNTFFGYINIPDENCLIYVTGKDSSGFDFLRVHPIQFMPSVNIQPSTNYTQPVPPTFDTFRSGVLPVGANSSDSIYQSPPPSDVPFVPPINNSLNTQVQPVQTWPTSTAYLLQIGGAGGLEASWMVVLGMIVSMIWNCL